MKHSNSFLKEIVLIAQSLDSKILRNMASALDELRSRNGRLFILGVGGSAANASHAVNDFRKIVGIECYSPSDNVSELTARINDEGWNSSYKEWLITSNLSNDDALFIFSVGGGDLKNKISVNLIQAIQLAKKRKTTIIGVTGPNGGYTKKNANFCLLVPVLNKKNLTAITESFQSIIWHMLVSHPDLKKNLMKWESILGE